MKFETKILEKEGTLNNMKPIKWSMVIQDECGSNCLVQLELNRRDVFELYEASRKAFNEYNETI